MLELLILLPLFMVGLLNLTFQISVDEITDVSRKNYFSFRKYEEKGYREVLDKGLYFNFALNSDEFAGYSSVEQNLHCGCDCASKKVLDEEQVPNPVKCLCDCRGSKDENNHKEDKLWNPSSCEDNCPDDTPKICPHGFYFYQRYCRCIPINGEYQKPETRRRPPV